MKVPFRVLLRMFSWKLSVLFLHNFVTIHQANTVHFRKDTLKLKVYYLTCPKESYMKSCDPRENYFGVEYYITLCILDSINPPINLL